MGVPGPAEVPIPHSPANYAEHWCSLLKKTETPFGRCHSTVDPAEYYKVGGTHTPRPPCHRGGLRAPPDPMPPVRWTQGTQLGPLVAVCACELASMSAGPHSASLPHCPSTLLCRPEVQI